MAATPRGRFRAALLASAVAAGACTAPEPSAGAFASAGSGAASGSSGAAAASGGSTAAGGATPLVFSSVARRLSRAELDNTLADVLGITTRPASQLLIEDEYAPYDNDYTLQRASQALVDGLQSVAEEVARAAVSNPTTRARLVPCAPSGPGDAACFRQVIQSVGQRLFRRPLRAEEVEAYLTLQTVAASANPTLATDFYTAVELFLRSVLQDPEFLYRIEVGTPLGAGVAALDPFEVATRLSFLISGTTPDDALLVEAARGTLLEASARRAAAVRLLADARSRLQLHRFHAMWLGYRSIPHPAELAQGFAAETNALIDRVVFEGDQSYLDLFRLNETFVDAKLASHYGLPAPLAGAAWVTYPDAGRAGILSHGSVLSAFSKFSDTSPTQRGILVRARLMCLEVPPPPANVDVDQPPGDPQALCKADRYAEHRASPSCAACHDQVDPVGFGLERYDMAGRFRVHEADLPSCAIDGRGELPGYGSFSGPAELGQKLIESRLLDACVVQQYLTYASGRRLEASDKAASDALLARFRAQNHDLSSLILDWVTSPEFAQRREPTP